MMLWRLLMGLLLTTSSCEEMSREAVHDDPAAVYPYHLLAVSSFGRIPDDALPGSEIPIDQSRHKIAGLHAQDSSGYMKLELYENVQYETQGNETSNGARKQLGTKVWILPTDMKIDISSEHVIGSDVEKAVFVDENLNLAIGENPEIFKDLDEIEFWVVAVNHSGQHSVIVSNPLAFLITIEHPESVREGATIYVGIVFGAVCLFALLIPLTVRTKRRLSQGKPIFACGSHRPAGEDEDGHETESGSRAKVKDEGRDNLAMMLNEGRIRDDPRHESFQSHEMRSFSEHHFQPHWLDPHYKTVYEHPDYQKQSKQQQHKTVHQAEINTPAAAVPGISSGSHKTVAEKL